MAVTGSYNGDGVFSVYCTATGTNGANCTVTYGSEDIASIVRTDEGEYTVTFVTWGPKLIGHSCVVGTAVDAVGKLCLVKTFDSSAGTVLIETWELATEAVAAAKNDVVSGETLFLSFTFAR